MFIRFFYGIRIALRQSFHEWLATLCLCMAIAAVILPILLMFGLKNGVIYSKTEKLRKDPNTLLISPNGRLDSNIRWTLGELRAIERSPHLQHVVPQADMVYRLGGYLESDSFRIEQKYFQTRTPFRITQEDDPLLAFGRCKCPGDGEIVLNFALAKILKVKEGDVLTVSFDSSPRSLRLSLTVVGILPNDYVNVDGVSNTFACVNIELANAIMDLNAGEDSFGKNKGKLTSPAALYDGTYWVPNRRMSNEELAEKLPDFRIMEPSISEEQKALLPEDAVRIQYADTVDSDRQRDEWKKRMQELGEQGVVLRWVAPITTVLEKNGTPVTLSCAYNAPRLCAAMQEQCSPEHATLYESEPSAEGGDNVAQKRRVALECAERLQHLLSEALAIASSGSELAEKLRTHQQWLESSEESRQGASVALTEAGKALESAKIRYAVAQKAAAEQERELQKATEALNSANSKENTAGVKDGKKNSGSKNKKNAGKKGKKADPVQRARSDYGAAEANKKDADGKLAAAKEALEKAQKEFDEKNAANAQIQDELTRIQNELAALQQAAPPDLSGERADLVKQLQEAKGSYSEALQSAGCSVPEGVEALIDRLSGCLSSKVRAEDSATELQKCREEVAGVRPVPHFTFDELYPLVEGSVRDEMLILSKTGSEVNGKALVRIEKRYGLPGKAGTLYTAPEDAARLSYCASAYNWNYKEAQEKDRLVRVGRYYKFVAYATDMDAVEPALRELSARGIECTSSVGEIEKTRKLDHNLTLLLLVLSALSGTGGMVALVLNLVNSAEKRRKDYALLRTIGVGRISMALMPIYESLFVMLSTLLICFAAYYSLHFALNSMARNLLDDQETMFNMPLRDLLSIVGICLVLSVLAALLSAFRLSRLSPAEYLREM